MELVKKNLLSIICGVVAILAIVLVYFPIGGWYDSLNTKLANSKKMYDEIVQTQRTGNQVKMPVVKLDSTESPNLGQFPTKDILEAAEAVALKMAEESKKLLKTAMEMNEHHPLVPDALPMPRGNGLIDFRGAYHQRFPQFLQAMKATAQPTSVDVTNETNARLAKRMDQVPIINGVREAGQEAAVKAIFDEEEAPLIVDQLKVERARKGVVYATEASFDHYAGIPNTADRPTIENIWVGQIGMWVQEDVVNAIMQANAKATGVDNAVVKRLVSIAVDREYLTRNGKVGVGTGPQGAVGGERGAATAAPVDDTTVSSAKVFRFSPTGRVSNDQYDVVNFTVVVEADARNFRAFLANLTNRRLITPRDIQILGVDRDKRQRQGFVYGKDPVVRVQVRCEAVFLHEWALKYMPPSIQKLLNVQQPGAGTVAGNY
jgi:hypothetical protein